MNCFNFGLNLIHVTSERAIEIDTIYHRPAMQTENFHPEDKPKMPETRFTEFPPLSVNPRVGD